MRLTSFKRWHWIAIGLLTGCALGCTNVLICDTGDAPVGIGQREFETLLRSTRQQPEFPLLDNITVIPVAGLYWVRAERRHLRADGHAYEYRTEWLALRGRQYTPTDPQLRPTDSKSDYTVRDFLKEMAARYPHVRFRYAWERDASIALPVWSVGGALLIGGLWPILLRFLTGPENTKDEDRHGVAPFNSISKTKQTTGATIGDVDRESLLKLEAELERKFSGSAGQQTTPSVELPSSEKSEHGTARNETSLAPPTVTLDTKAKEYVGEFYPTEAHARTHQTQPKQH